jgi:hypothetical protein
MGDCARPVAEIAPVIAVGETVRGGELSKKTLPDWLTAQRTEGLCTWSPAVYPHEFHMSSPKNDKKRHQLVVADRVGKKVFSAV